MQSVSMQIEGLSAAGTERGKGVLHIHISTPLNKRYFKLTAFRDHRKAF